jgi:cytochrome d ubiquinol oxidase subunit I
MTIAAYLTTAFVVGGIGAYYLWRKRHVKHARIMFGMAMLMAVFVAPLQPVIGDLHGLNTLEHQPAKVAAMEGLWETETGYQPPDRTHPKRHTERWPLISVQTI